MKILKLICIIVVVIVLIPNACADGENIKDIIPSKFERDFYDIQVDEDPSDVIELFSLHNILDLFLKGINEFSPQFASMIFSLLSLIIVFNFLDQISFYKTKSTYRTILSCLCTTLLTVVLFSYFTKTWELIEKAMESSQIFCNASVPIMSALLIDSGKPISASWFAYVVSLSGNVITVMTNQIFLPLTRIIFAVGICSGIWSDFYVLPISDMIEKFIKWTMGILFSLFTMAMSMQGILVKSGDGVTRKVIKSAVSGIPVMGSMISGGIESAFTIANGVKTTTAVIGIAVIIAIYFSPFIMLLLQNAAVYITLTVSQMLGQKVSVNILKTIYKTYSLMIGLVAMSVLMCGICYLIMCLGAS